MTRLRALTLVVLAACAGREVSKLRYTSTDCPDPNGCGAPVGEREYHPPDEAHDPVADAAATSERPSCKTVAIAMAALELGNYASEETDEERAAIIANQQKACEGAKLDERELACMSTVTHAKHVGYCTRKMGAPTPRVPMLSRAECTELIAELRPSLSSYGQGDHAVIYQASCVDDGWSTDLATCFRNGRGYNLTGQCRHEAPGWLFDRIQARIDNRSAKN